MTTNYRALIVDDDLYAREAMLTALMDVGFECEAAADGEIADSSLKKPFDVVVTDLRMPRRNGHALAMDLVSRGPERPLVVVLTGVLEPRLIKDLIARGVDDVNFKPTDLNLLGVKIRALCDRRQKKLNESPQPSSTTPAHVVANGDADVIKAELVQAQVDAISPSQPRWKQSPFIRAPRIDQTFHG